MTGTQVHIVNVHLLIDDRFAIQAIFLWVICGDISRVFRYANYSTKSSVVLVIVGDAV